MSRHPFLAAWETRDLDTWAGALAPDVVAHSPMLTAPFSGREAVLEIYDVLFGVFDEFDVTDEFAAGETDMFFWRASVACGRVEGTDLIRHDENGKISEIRVLIRPLAGIAAFAAAVGPPLARQRGRVRFIMVRLLAAPLRWLLVAADRISGRFVH